MKSLFVCAVTCLLAATVAAADTLDIYVVDTEGGKAVIVLTPDGETMLVDAGYPTQGRPGHETDCRGRQAAGIKQLTVSWPPTTMPTQRQRSRVDTRIPGKVFVDHGEPTPTLNAGSRSSYYEPYVKAIVTGSGFVRRVT